MKIILSSNNRKKIKEIREIFGEGYDVLSLSDVGFTDDIDENGSSFEENAFIKVHAVSALFPDCVVIADDSGICVDALGGAPGIYSARFSGVHGDDEANNNKLLAELQDKPDRSAHYYCAVAVRLPDGTEFSTCGKCFGVIAKERKGSGGFGYDPLFFLPEYGKMMAELTDDEKNAVSHRGKALRKLKEEFDRRIK